MKNLEIKHVECDIDIDDDNKLLLFKDGIEIGYIIYQLETYSDNYTPNIDGQEICDIVDQCDNFILLEKICISEEYRGDGLGNYLMSYFCDNIVKDNVCILLKHAVDIPLNKDRNLYNKTILPNFYNKYNFNKVGDSNYYVKNY